MKGTDPLMPICSTPFPTIQGPVLLPQLPRLPCSTAMQPGSKPSRELGLRTLCSHCPCIPALSKEGFQGDW